jgi:predicted small metal-binding protein
MTSYSIRCKDTGANCGFEIRGASSVDEVLQELAVHAKIVHGMTAIPPDVVAGIRKAIKEG